MSFFDFFKPKKSKLITAKYIRTFNPCSDRINHFEKVNPKFKGSIVDLLKLENITYSDKIWVAVKVVDYRILQLWSIECAESVLPNYKKIFPNDNRLDEVFVTLRKVLAGELPVSAAESAATAAWSAATAAWSAARSAAWSAARSAAESAESAAASAARSAAESAESAAASAAWSAATAAWSAARSAAETAAWSAESAEKQQEDLNIILLITLLESNKE